MLKYNKAEFIELVKAIGKDALAESAECSIPLIERLMAGNYTSQLNPFLAKRLNKALGQTIFPIGDQPGKKTA